MRGAVRSIGTVRTWDPSQRRLRAAVLLGPVVALLAAGLAGNGPAVWAVVVVLLLSVLWAAAPESAAGSLALLLVLLWWTRVPDDALHPTVLVAAVALLAAHLSAVVSAAAPPRTPVDPAVLRLWLARGSGVLVAAPLLWLLARGLRGDDPPAVLWPAALLALVLVVLAATVALGRRETS